jgi:predicted permease
MLGRFGRKKRALLDFDEEIQAHIEFEIEELKQDGLDEEEARYAAMRKFGNVTITRERFYESGRWLWLDALVRNMSFAFRLMRHRPLSTLAIIVLLALGTGGVTAVFNPIYSMLFAPLPFPQPEQLVRIGGDIRMFETRQSSLEKEDLLERIFSNTAAYIPNITRIGIQVPETNKKRGVYVTEVSDKFFETLGVRPFMGPGFSGEKHMENIVVSYRFWRDEMMGADDAIGRHVFAGQFGGMPRIAGVMPEGFNFPADTDVWVCRIEYWTAGNDTQLAGRLRPGISVEQAAKELQAINSNLVRPLEAAGNSGPLLQSLQSFLYGDQRPLLRLLGAAAVMFLALVCVGVVNLLIAQGARRKQEIATRLIMGASRRNLVFQLLTETLPLVVVGVLAGWRLSEIVSAWMWAQFPALHGGAVTIPVKMAFLLALMLVTTLLGGLIPSLYATGLDLNAYLKAASSGGRRFFSSREFFVGVQLGLALALLIGVGVLIRSMMFRVDFPVGWSSREVAVINASPADNVVVDIDDPSIQRPMYFQNVYRELNALPEVISVGSLTPIPFTTMAVYLNSMPNNISKTSRPQGQKWPPGTPTAVYAEVSPDVFDVLDIPLLAGRSFTTFRTEGAGYNGDVVINQALAQLLWPGENAVGKVFFLEDGGRDSARVEVVGVVRNYYHTPTDNDFKPTVYISQAGRYLPVYQLLVKLRPGTSLKNFQANVQQRLSGLAAAPTNFEITPLSEHVKEATASRRLTLQLLGAFAVLGIVVSGLGLYATAALMAATWKREMGIRMAMGAQFWDILRLAFWRGFCPGFFPASLFR